MQFEIVVKEFPEMPIAFEIPVEGAEKETLWIIYCPIPEILIGFGQSEKETPDIVLVSSAKI